MTFEEVITKLADGKAYRFSTPGLKGFFYKAPFPADSYQTKADGAHSAITYWEPMSDGVGFKKASPTLMLYDFQDDEWLCRETAFHPSIAKS